MNHERVTSSQIYSIAHDGEAGEIRFHARGCPGGDACKDCAGPVYRYPTMTVDQHKKLMTAESKGSHFIKHLRSQLKDYKKL